jgi:hypothetical protein
MIMRAAQVRMLTITGIVLGLTALSGCTGSNVRETLGITRKAPDEFRVVSRPPLTVPPQFSLRPPSIDEESPNQLATSAQAKELLMGSAENNALAPASGKKANSQVASTGITTASKADAQFLERAGAPQANPNIRRELTEEKITKQHQQEEESWWDKISMFPESKDPTVNANKESERIQANEESGKPVTDGETPVVKSKDRGILGRILEN